MANEGPNGYDVGVFKFADPIEDAIFYPFFQGDELGEEMTMMGWGDTGEAGMDEDDTYNDKKFRVAKNIVTDVSNGVLTYRFDEGDDGLENEGLAFSGDSGSPAFIDGQLAGVNSGGDCCDYGSLDQYKRLQTHLGWIGDIIGLGGDYDEVPDCDAFSNASAFQSFKYASIMLTAYQLLI